MSFVVWSVEKGARGSSLDSAGLLRRGPLTLLKSDPSHKPSPVETHVGTSSPHFVFSSREIMGPLMPTSDPTLVKKPYFHFFQPFQALGVPGQVDGSGYIVVNSTAVDAQVLVTVDASMLQGLLVLSTTEVRVQMGGVQTRMAWYAGAMCS